MVVGVKGRPLVVGGYASSPYRHDGEAWLWGPPSAMDLKIGTEREPVDG